VGESATWQAYEPSPAVREQLAGLPRLLGRDLWRRVEIGDPAALGYLAAEVLVAALRRFLVQGDEEAAGKVAEALLERWGQYVLRQAWAWCPRSEEDRLDFRQEVWCRVWAEWRNPAERFWEVNFVHSLRCLCFDVGQWFARRRLPQWEPRPTEDGEQDEPDPPDPDRPLGLVPEERDRLLRALHSLDPATRRAVYLRYILDWPVAGAEVKVPTICQALGLSDRMVRIYLRRGEAALRAWYEEERAREAD
jgi:DNA-directed RNA polymerase specialized sigma24 family protein